jgi:succinyl-CoA synthetase alpha subunit
MGILFDKNRKVVLVDVSIQNRVHLSNMIAYGTNIVALVNQSDEKKIEGIPVYNSANKIPQSDIDIAVIFSDVDYVIDSVKDAILANIKNIVLVSEHIPLQDLVEIHNLLRINNVRLFGPSCSGIITVGESLLGICPPSIFSKGKVGVIGYGGTLVYETVLSLTKSGIGQSTCVVLGGETMPGTKFIDLLPMYEEDPKTELLIILGEIGGDDEEQAAEYMKTMKTPVIAYIAGKSAPIRKVMGHTGAIIKDSLGAYDQKVEALSEAGAKIAKSPTEIVSLVQSLT